MEVDSDFLDFERSELGILRESQHPDATNGVHVKVPNGVIAPAPLWKEKHQWYYSSTSEVPSQKRV